MRDLLLHQDLLEAIRARVPQKANLTNVLVDILSIDKMAVYRRLRGEVSFTFSEVILIARKLGISLDEFAQVDSLRSKPFQLKMTEHVNPQEIDYEMMQGFVDFLDAIKHVPDSEMAGSTNMIPSFFYYKYTHLTRFYLFKWVYQYGLSEIPVYYKDVHIPPRLRKLQQDTISYYRHFKMTKIIFDNLVFYYLVNDLKYFTNVHLIEPEELEMIKEELLCLLEDLERLSITAYYKENGNRIHFYISNINFDTNYSYMASNQVYLTMIGAFILNNVVSNDKMTFDRVKIWIHSLKRQSTLISESGEKQRILFFNKQRDIITSL
ncbi:MAG: hypothetical protein LIP08_03210 [Bacteroides sp.]|nr:hypothetical protein [Bacteroides sp.]